jgi:hypothetical protein
MNSFEIERVSLLVSKTRGEGLRGRVSRRHWKIFGAVLMVMLTGFLFRGIVHTNDTKTQSQVRVARVLGSSISLASLLKSNQPINSDLTPITSLLDRKSKTHTNADQRIASLITRFMNTYIDARKSSP